MIKVFYHQIKPGIDCPDGLVSAYVVKTQAPLYRDEVELVGCTYQGEIPEVNRGDRIYIVDFSFPRHVLEEWEQVASDLLVIDHHKTAMQDLEGFSAAVFDMQECGATLAYKTFNPGMEYPMPAFLQYVRDRDLWKHELPATHEIHEAVASIKYKIKSAVQDETISRDLIFAFFDKLIVMSQDELIAYLKPIGAVLLEEKRKKVEAIALRSIVGQVAGFTVPVIFLEVDGSEDRLVSDICQFLYKRHPEFPFVACRTSDGSWSLRSDQDNPNAADVSAIAKQFGGGGHRCAAGFKPQ